MKTTVAKTIALVASTASVSTVALAVVFPAQGATLVPFSFQTDVTTSPASDPTSGLLNDPTRDIRLNSVTFGGSSISQFELVKEAKVLQNDTYSLDDGSLLGVLNSGRGPNTSSDPLAEEGPSKPNPTGQDIVDSLGNLNLNSILVTRENANQASIEVTFENPVNTFFVWERGGTPGGSVAGDSDLLVEALANDSSTVLASYKILRENYTKANYNISSEVIPILNNGPFNIGSIGLRLNEGSTKTLRLTSSNNNSLIPNIPSDNGPDFKVVAAVPEPSMVVSTLIAGGLGIVLKRRRVVADRC